LGYLDLFLIIGDPNYLLILDALFFLCCEMPDFVIMFKLNS